MNETASEHVTWPSRMSIPLSEAERKKVIALKAELQQDRRTLKDFVMEAMWEKWQKEKERAKRAA